ncbi:MAG: VCBS repeat-containing protein [Oscillospiraceae bacterium]|nr:VCBS repeat-containing protein [Oscillospiraceae bacterium]
MDFDGDGAEEVISFFILPGDNPLKIYIFRDAGHDYELADIIESVGANFESARYADLDGDGVLELIVGHLVSPALRSMTVYSIRGLTHTKLAEAVYSALSVYDFTGDGRDDLAVTRLSSSEFPGEVELFSFPRSGEPISYTAQLSFGVESLVRVLPGRLATGESALFVDGKPSGGALVTDVFTVTGSALKNISVSTPGGVSMSTLRDVPVYTADINRDGAPDVPMPRLLPQQSDARYYAYDWYTFTADGMRRLALSTFHNESDGWYFILRPEWRGYVTVRRESHIAGERTIIFSHTAGGALTDFLKIYTLTGENSENRERLPNRFRLYHDWGTIYAAEILDSGGQISITESDVNGAFSRIVEEWSFGS